MTHSHIISSKIIELCETTSKQRCPDCYLSWEVGIVFCTCGRCLRISQSHKEVDKSNNDVVSIPGYVIKKSDKRGAKHGPSERQQCMTRLKKCCIKLVKGNMENTHPFLRDGIMTSNSKKSYMTELLWRIIHHSYVATKAERIRNSEHWILKLKQDGAQQT